MKTHSLSSHLTEPAYVLVYLARPELPGKTWWDRTNDPELRDGPLTWGICRPNVRAFGTMPGAHLFFVAYDHSRPAVDRYRLTTYFRVDGSRVLDHAKAREQFGTRRNVLLDYLATGSSLPERVAAYVDEHFADLCWWNELSRRAREDDLTHLKEHADDHILWVRDKPYIHAWWDHHSLPWGGKPGSRVWRHAAQTPYLVADMTVSRVLRKSVPYNDVAALRGRKEASDLLNGANRHPPFRLGNPEALAELLNLFEEREFQELLLLIDLPANLPWRVNTSTAT